MLRYNIYFKTPFGSFSYSTNYFLAIKNMMQDSDFEIVFIAVNTANKTRLVFNNVVEFYKSGL